MNTFLEAVIGLTDLPIAVSAIIFSILSLKNGNKGWGAVFFFTGISAIIGTVAHTFTFPSAVYRIIWTVLYLLLFESVRRFAVIMIGYVRKPFVFGKYIMAAEAILYIVCLFFLYAVEKYDILILVVFSALCLGSLVYNLVRYKYRNKYIYLIFGLLVLAVLLQILAGKLRFLIVLEHLSLFAALFAVYLMSRESRNN